MKPLRGGPAYSAYMRFLEEAERKRRWSIFDDIPWESLSTCPRDEALATCAETFCGVEMYLPDYSIGHLQVIRGESFGQLWFAAQWAQEESRHALALREYLTRSGQRTEQDFARFEEQILGGRWTLPFEDPRQMTIYGILQETATCMIYSKQMRRAQEVGDEVLATIYRYIARDEAAHSRWYQNLTRLYMEEDRAGTLRDISHVARNFHMPAEDLVPDYEARIAVMRQAGIDRGAFLRQVLLPSLKSLELTWHDLDWNLDVRSPVPVV